MNVSSEDGMAARTEGCTYAEHADGGTGECRSIGGWDAFSTEQMHVHQKRRLAKCCGNLA